MLHTIWIAGRDVTFEGAPSDPFFQRLPEFHQENRALERYARDSLPSDAVCLDIGANIGLTALVLSLHCPDGLVFAFEPSPVNATHLRRNVARNGIRNVRVLEAALGREAGAIHFSTPQHAANSTVLRDGGEGVTVPLMRLDDWCAAEKVTRIDFIKLDVEGYEPEVLAGAAASLCHHRPPIYMEFNSVMMMFEARISPLTFAEAIWGTFDVFALDENEGALTPAINARDFTFQNVMAKGCLEDVLMHPKEGLTEDALLAALPQTQDTVLVLD